MIISKYRNMALGIDGESESRGNGSMGGVAIEGKASSWTLLGMLVLSICLGASFPEDEGTSANDGLGISARVGVVNPVLRNASWTRVYPFGDDGGARTEALVVALVQADVETGKPVKGVAVSEVELRDAEEGDSAVRPVGATYFFPEVTWAKPGEWIRMRASRCSRGILLSLFRPEHGTEIWLFEQGVDPKKLLAESSGLDKTLRPWHMVGWDGGDGKGTRLLGAFREHEKARGWPTGPQKLSVYREGKWSAVEVPKREFEPSQKSRCTDLRLARAGSVCRVVGTLVSRTRSGSVFEFEWGGRVKFVDVASAYPEFEQPGKESSEAFINPLYDNGAGTSEFDGFGVILNKRSGYPSRDARLTPVSCLQEVTLGRLSMKTGFESIRVSIAREARELPREMVQINSALLSGLNKVGYLIKYHSFSMCTISVIPEAPEGPEVRFGLVMVDGGELLGSHTVMLGVPGSKERALFAPSEHITGLNISRPKRGQLSTVFLGKEGMPTKAKTVDWAECALSERVIVLQ